MAFKQLILLGPPGIDIEAYAIALSERWHIPDVSMERLIQDAIAKESSMGLEAQSYIDTGEQLPDKLIMKLLRKRFEQPDVMLQGWILSGFPHTQTQAQSLNDFLSAVGQPAAKVAYLKVMTGLLINRLSSSEHYTSIPAIRQCLARHQEKITPILEYYQQQQQLTITNANKSVAEVTQVLFELFEEETSAARFISESELDSLLARESLLVVDCMASWCGSCKLVTPLIDQLADAYRDRVNVMKIDFDANKQVTKRFGLKGMPAVMFFKSGELVETLTGVKPYQAYDAAITRFLE